MGEHTKEQLELPPGFGSLRPKAKLSLLNVLFDGGKEPPKFIGRKPIVHHGLDQAPVVRNAYRYRSASGGRTLDVEFDDQGDALVSFVDADLDGTSTVVDLMKGGVGRSYGAAEQMFIAIDRTTGGGRVHGVGVNGPGVSAGAGGFELGLIGSSIKEGRLLEPDVRCYSITQLEPGIGVGPALGLGVGPKKLKLGFFQMSIEGDVHSLDAYASLLSDEELAELELEAIDKQLVISRESIPVTGGVELQERWRTAAVDPLVSRKQELLNFLHEKQLGDAHQGPPAIGTSRTDNVANSTTLDVGKLNSIGHGVQGLWGNIRCGS
ncbi:MAG: hypothetical protein KDB87_13245 [Flavobacteriales bacterium]|nr:hypothetical protein [Flavobacteriales bacterium]MCB0785367.1 hypothetical protein [Flavobacteriales bacterium]MCB0814110.1 hypothetical protein [Flavobacteriales bacterium]